MIIKEVVGQDKIKEMQSKVEDNITKRQDIVLRDTIPIKISLADVIVRFENGERNKAFKFKRSNFETKALEHLISVPKTSKAGNTYSTDYCISICDTQGRPSVRIYKLGFFDQVTKKRLGPAELIERGSITTNGEYIQLIDPTELLYKQGF